LITGEIRNKIDKIWTDMWAGGITNPLTVVEQITYLMFIRSLDEKEIETEKLEALTSGKLEKIFSQNEDEQSMRWSKFKDKDSREIYGIISQKVFPFIKSLNGNKASSFTRYMESALFMIPTPQILQKIVTGLDDLYETDLTGLDMQGDLYEYMLDKLTTAGQNGQFRTPKHIREMMVNLIKPTPDDIICDPACGTAGFLVSASEYIRKNYEATMTNEQWKCFDKETFTGFDTDPTMLRISAMNLMLHSISNPDIDYKDSVSKQNDITSKYTVCLANPPFSGTIDSESIHDNLKAICNTKKTELLFVALFLRMLIKGGQCACIAPDGVLFGSSKAHKELRKELVENQHLRAIISMPSGVFKPYAGVSTAVLIFTKTDDGGTDKVWFYDMKADGKSLDDKRQIIKENDIPDIVERFNNLDKEGDRKRTDKSFFVPKDEIVQNDYDLSINKYKEIEYEKVEYDSTDVILRNIEKLHGVIAEKLKELKGLLDE
jgi:type I restriction enzyme M protein